jgi:nucleoside-diphosphate-sugar epimerase
MLLITGITGHSGKYFLQELINNHYSDPIRCIIRKSSDISLLDKTGLKIEKIIGDLSDEGFLNEAMIDVDTILHIASIFYSSNIIKAAVKNNVRRVILVHTTGIYSKYKSASEIYKNIEINIGKMLQTSNHPIGLIYLRPTMIYGNIHDRNIIIFIKMLDKFRWFPVIEHGKSLIQPVNGRDLGKAYYQILMKTNIMNGDYILSGEKPISILDLYRLISNYLDKKTKYFNIPLWLGLCIARIFKFFTLGKIDYIEKVQRMCENRSFSHNAATRDFGYKPMPLEEGIKIEVEEYLEKCRG